MKSPLQSELRVSILKGALNFYKTSCVISCSLSIFSVLYGAAHAQITAIRVPPSPRWRGITGNWSTFEISVGNPGQIIPVTVSSISSGVGVPLTGHSADNDVPFITPWFSPDNSTTWLELESPDNSTSQGVDHVQIVQVSTGVTTTGIELINETTQTYSDFGWIGLGNTTHDHPVLGEPLLSQFLSGMPGLSYGYTAGASYGGTQGVPASLTLGGWDQYRIQPAPKSWFPMSRDPLGQVVPTVDIQWIYTSIQGVNDKDSTLYDGRSSGETLVTLIDLATPYLWLPETICDLISTIFNVTWDEKLQLYQISDTFVPRDLIDSDSSSPMLHFHISGPAKTNDDDAISTLSISLSALVLKMKIPTREDASQSPENPTDYKELTYLAVKRGMAQTGYYTLGRALLQESYIFTDYYNGTFFLAQAMFPENPATNFSIVDTIHGPETTTSTDRTGIIVGASMGSVGVLFLILLAWMALYFLWRRKGVITPGPENFGDAHSGFTAHAPEPPMTATLDGVVGRGERSLGDSNASPSQHTVNRSLGWAPDEIVHSIYEETTNDTPPGWTPREIRHAVYGETLNNVPPQSDAAPIPSLGNQAPTATTTIGVSVLHETSTTPIEDRSDSTDQESPGTATTSTKSLSTSGSSVMAPILEIHKQKAVDTLMEQLKSLLNHSPHVGLSIRAGGGDASPSSSTLHSSLSSKERASGSKRGREKTETVTSTEGECLGSTKRQKLESLHKPRFACPFYLRNPKKHLRHRACAGPGWTEVRRVKEHLYRDHALPIHCHRCGTIMKSEASLRSHSRQVEGCEVRPINLPEGIDKAQEMELRKKKHGETEEERWYAMYKIIFPDEDGDLVPSPYYPNPNTDDGNMDELKQYERFQRRELLRIVRRLLEESAAEIAGPLEDQLSSRFESIVRQAQAHVYKAYRGQENTNQAAGSALASRKATARAIVERAQETSGYTHQNSDRDRQVATSHQSPLTPANVLPPEAHRQSDFDNQTDNSSSSLMPGPRTPNFLDSAVPGSISAMHDTVTSLPPCSSSHEPIYVAPVDLFDLNTALNEPGTGFLNLPNPAFSPTHPRPIDLAAPESSISEKYNMDRSSTDHQHSMAANLVPTLPFSSETTGSETTGSGPAGGPSDEPTIDSSNAVSLSQVNVETTTSLTSSTSSKAQVIIPVHELREGQVPFIDMVFDGLDWTDEDLFIIS